MQLARPVDDAVAGAHRERAVVEQADARAAEDVEDLLLRGLPVEWRRPLAGIDLDSVEADRLRPGGGAEPRQERAQMALLGSSALDLVPMGDHSPIMSRAAPCAVARPPPPRHRPAAPPLRLPARARAASRAAPPVTRRAGRARRSDRAGS